MLRTTHRLVAVSALCGVTLYVLLGYYSTKTTAIDGVKVRGLESQWLLMRLWHRLSSYAPASDARVRPEAEGPSAGNAANDDARRDSSATSAAAGTQASPELHTLDSAALKMRLTPFWSKAEQRNGASGSQLPPAANSNAWPPTTLTGGSSAPPAARVLTPQSIPLPAAAGSYSRSAFASTAPAVSVATGTHPVNLDVVGSSNTDRTVPDVQSSLSEVLTFGREGASLPTELASAGAGADSLGPATGSSVDVSPQIFDYSDSDTGRPSSSRIPTIEWQSDKAVFQSQKQSDAGFASALPSAAPTASGSTQEFSGGIASSLNPTATTSATDVLDQRVSYVTGFVGIGRLGNNMFVYASVFAVALRHNFTAAFCLSDWQSQVYGEMKKLFRFSVGNTGGSFAPDKYIQEKGWGKYNSAVDDVKNFGKRTFLYSYLQSFKYFDAFTQQIKREFALTEEYGSRADTFLRRAAAGRVNLTFVGVHIRRGDMVGHSLYNAAPESYIRRAMEYFLKKYNADTNVLFVVASDDIDWTYDTLAKTGYAPIVVYTNDTIAGDMAILSRCNHSVITSGTYGWWAGWLTGGDVVYYRNFIPNTSALAGGYEPADYYPPYWIGMD